MKTQSHTPGPWDIFPNASKQEITIGNAQTHAPLVAATAVVTGLDHSAWANARLIAAAPELLDALENCYGLLEMHGVLTTPGLLNPAADTLDILSAARAAIAKATGKAQP